MYHTKTATFFETVSHVAQEASNSLVTKDGLELLILLPPPPKYYDYRPALLTLAKLLVEEFLSIANRRARHVHGTFIY